MSYGFSVCFAISSFIKLFSNYPVCVFRIFPSWALTVILIENYYTSRSIAYKLSQSCLASNTEFILLYYQSFKKM